MILFQRESCYFVVCVCLGPRFAMCRVSQKARNQTNFKYPKWLTSYFGVSTQSNQKVIQKRRKVTFLGNRNWTQTSFFSNFSGASGISRQNPGISRPKSLISLVSRDVSNFLAPTRSRGRPLPYWKISGPKSLGLGSFFLPDFSLVSITLSHFSATLGRSLLSHFLVAQLLLGFGPFSWTAHHKPRCPVNNLFWRPWSGIRPGLTCYVLEGCLDSEMFSWWRSTSRGQLLARSPTTN